VALQPHPPLTLEYWPLAVRPLAIVAELGVMAMLLKEIAGAEEPPPPPPPSPRQPSRNSVDKSAKYYRNLLQLSFILATSLS